MTNEFPTSDLIVTISGIYSVYYRNNDFRDDETKKQANKNTDVVLPQHVTHDQELAGITEPSNAYQPLIKGNTEEDEKFEEGNRSGIEPQPTSTEYQ